MDSFEHTHSHETPDSEAEATEALNNLSESFDLEELVEQIEEILAQVMESLDGLFAFDFFEEMPEITDENIEAVAAGIAADPEAIRNLDVPLARQGHMETVLDSMPELRSYVGSFEGLGGRAASVVTHADFNPNQPYRIVYHYHGTHGQDPGYNDRFQRTMETFRDTTDSQTAIVYGLSSEERSRESDQFQYDHEWPEDANLYHQEVLSVLETNFGADPSNCNHITVEGHSAGGLALRNCAEQGFAANRYLSLDGSYGDWIEDAYDALQEQGIDTDFQIILATERTEQDLDDDIENQEGVTVVRADTSHAGTINEFLGGIDLNSAEAQELLA